MTERKTGPRHNLRDVFPDTGTEITAKSWLTEAPMRMLMNNLHPDVAENPHDLVVYGGIGRAARTWMTLIKWWPHLKSLRTMRRCWCNPVSQLVCFAHIKTPHES